MGGRTLDQFRARQKSKTRKDAKTETIPAKGLDKPNSESEDK